MRWCNKKFFFYIMHFKWLLIGYSDIPIINYIFNITVYICNNNNNFMQQKSIELFELFI